MFGDGKVESIKEDRFTITFDGNVAKVIREDVVIPQEMTGLCQGTKQPCLCL